AADGRRILSRGGAPVQVGRRPVTKSAGDTVGQCNEKADLICSAFRAIPNRRRSSSMPQSIPRGLGRESVLKRSYGVHRLRIMNIRCKHVSASEAGDGFQVLFERAPDSDEGYVLVQRHFEFPDREECYVESDDREFCGHFRIRRALLSRNRFQMAFGRSPERKIAVSFDATDSVYTEIKRVLQIMIPDI